LKKKLRIFFINDLKFSSIFRSLFSASLKIEESIDSSFKLIETLFDTNDFETVISMAEQNCENNIFESATKLQILMLRAILTMETVIITNYRLIFFGFKIFLCSF
jgi:hypothetical protein